jgi:ABC-type transporter Mla subunit MlaD
MTACWLCGKLVDMASSKGANPSRSKSAAQAAVETAAQGAVETAQAAVESAQAVVSGTLRIPRASAQIAAQLPDLVENLAVATERLNATIDRAERYMALADPMFRAMDRLLPQLEALIATGNDVFKALSNIPGVSRLGRLVTERSSGKAADPKVAGRRPKD